MLPSGVLTWRSSLVSKPSIIARSDGVHSKLKSASSCCILYNNRVRHLSTSFLRQRYSADPGADMEYPPADPAPVVPVLPGVALPRNSPSRPSVRPMVAPPHSAALPPSPPVQGSGACSRTVPAPDARSRLCRRLRQEGFSRPLLLRRRLL